MKIMSWNIQNGGAQNNVMDKFNYPIIGNIDNVLSVIEEQSPDVLSLQEFQYQYWNELVENESNGLKKQGYNYFEYRSVLEERTARNGVLICTKNLKMELENDPRDIDDYSKRNWVEVYLPEVDILILSVDVPLIGKDNDSREREKYLKALKRRFLSYSKMTNPATIIGDFNLFDSPNCSFWEYMVEYKRILFSLGDIITFGDHQNDYIFGNKEFNNRFIMIEEGNNDSTTCSDHKAVFAVER